MCVCKEERKKEREGGEEEEKRNRETEGGGRERERESQPIVLVEAVGYIVGHALGANWLGELSVAQSSPTSFSLMD